MKYTVRYIDERNFHEVYSWCVNNCQDSFYPGSDWDNWAIGESNRMVQFENEADAILFTLRWS